MPLGGGKDGLRDPRQEVDLQMVGDVDRVVDDGSAVGRRDRGLGGGQVGFVGLDAVRGAVDRAAGDVPDTKAAAGELGGDGRAGRSGSEDDVQVGVGAGHDYSPVLDEVCAVNAADRCGYHSSDRRRRPGRNVSSRRRA